MANSLQKYNLDLRSTASERKFNRTLEELHTYRNRYLRFRNVKSFTPHELQGIKLLIDITELKLEEIDPKKWAEEVLKLPPL